MADKKSLYNQFNNYLQESFTSDSLTLDRGQELTILFKEQYELSQDANDLISKLSSLTPLYPEFSTITAPILEGQSTTDELDQVRGEIQNA